VTDEVTDGESAEESVQEQVVAGLAEHEVRSALLDLFAEVDTLTATEAAQRLGYSSGLCSFHLRQLARYGYVEESPHSGGRARPWRLRQAEPDLGQSPIPLTLPSSTLPSSAPEETPGGFSELARGLEDESYRRWLDQRDQAPDEWSVDEAFSAVVYLTPEETGEVAEAVRRTLAGYRDRERRPSARPANARPVALIARLFPLLPGPATDGG
jgi:predicted ArsR family transcriptional regulator